MIFTLSDYIESGVVDNRTRGITRLTLQPRHCHQVIDFELEGDCLRDLAGCSYSFKLAAEGANGADLPESFMGNHRGLVGDMTASRKLTSHQTNKLCNTLSLEWFTPNFGMFMLQTAPEEFQISAPEWTMDKADEQAQLMVNKQVLRDYVQGWVDYYSQQSETPDTDTKWDVKLRRAEGMAICYRVLYDKYYLDGGPISERDRQANLYFALSWDDKLKHLADASERGEEIPYTVFPDLALLDGLNKEDLPSVRRMCSHRLIKRVEQITNIAKKVFESKISREALEQEMPSDDITTVFKAIRFLSTKLLSCLLQINDLENKSRRRKGEKQKDSPNLAIDGIVSQLELCVKQILGANKALVAIKDAEDMDTDALQSKMEDLRSDIVEVGRSLITPQ